VKTIIAGQVEEVSRKAEARPSVRWALASLALSVLLSSLGTSIANVALPNLAEAFNASFQAVQWIVIAYLLAITTLIVSAGRLGDLIGRKKLLLIGIFLFTFASLLCSMAPTLVAADCCPCAARPWRSHHDGPCHGVRQRDGSERKNGQCHWPAGDDVGNRHCAGPIARWRPDRRTRLAGNISHQPAAGCPDTFSRPSLPAR
jgi:hypothetical protein